MNKASKSDNGANLIIDALLMRMAAKDRFSDDDIIIKNNKLLPFDVVIDKDGKFGVVVEYQKTVGFWRCQIIGQCKYKLDTTHTYNIRTVNELEAIDARLALGKFWGL